MGLFKTTLTAAMLSSAMGSSWFGTYAFKGGNVMDGATLQRLADLEAAAASGSLAINNGVYGRIGLQPRMCTKNAWSKRGLLARMQTHMRG
jgi:hypothetical protein